MIEAETYLETTDPARNRFSVARSTLYAALKTSDQSSAVSRIA